MNIQRIVSGFLLALCIAGTGHALAAESPDQSIYHVGSDWVNQNNETVNIASLAGEVQVMAFVYTYCEHSCPVILGKLKAIERGLTDDQKQAVTFQLITLDPEKDTPDALRKYMQQKELDPESWNMLNGHPDDVLELSALVGVRYKPMDNGEGISHSNMITVLDKQGRLYYQMKGLDVDMEQVIAQIIQATQMQP